LKSSSKPLRRLEANSYPSEIDGSEGRTNDGERRNHTSQERPGFTAH
jgi:hypothetical protein